MRDDVSCHLSSSYCALIKYEVFVMLYEIAYMKYYFILMKLMRIKVLLSRQAD